MAYATAADLISRYGWDELLQLTDRAGTGAIDYAVVAQALTDATGTVETYLANRYSLPLSPLPALVVKLTCDIARYALHGKAVTDSVRQAYTDAMKVLADLASGTAALVGAAAVDPGVLPSGPPGVVKFAAPTRQLDRNDACGNIADYQA